MSYRRAVERVFSPHGTLARVVEGYEWRAGQSEMAGSVAKALEGDETWIIEAPTGVGKSLAYLVPGALWAQGEGKVLLVSTYTRNLQDQILRRDLPLLRRVTSRKIDVAVLKGRANYLCRRRWLRARDDLSGTTDGELLVRALEGWAQVTESGDFDEGPPIAGRLRSLLSRLASDPRHCASGDCSPESGCFFKLSRRRAREAHVVLVNHSLLVLDLLAGGAGLPPWDGLVVDEAHHLPHVAADAMARRVSFRSWSHAFLGLGGQGEPGATDLVRRLIRPGRSRAERTRMLHRLRDLESGLGGLLAFSRQFFEDLNRTGELPAPGARSRYRLGAGSGGPFPASTYPLIEAASGLITLHRDLLLELRNRAEGADADALLSEIERVVEGVEAERDSLSFLVEASEPATVYWIEDDPTEGVVLRSRPLDLSDALGHRLAGGGPLILTSATLAADGSTRFFARKCGLAEEAQELILPPVFPIEEQVRLLAPKMVREPNVEGHEGDLAEAIQRLAVAIPRKILVLFTAHATLQRVYERIRGPLEDRGIWVYAQGREASRSALTAAFQESERAVLLGAASFWEGVDFPGAELEILIIVRLPFPVPTDPFVEAYSERLREEGGDPFESYMLPEAIVRFRQGFGRLIRRREDRGVLAVLDPRILRRRYGARFARAVGLPATPVESWEALVGETERWFRGTSEPHDTQERKR